MKHRLISGTGFGSNVKVELNNKGKVNKKFADAAIEAYFQKWDGFDFQIENNFVAVGIEPSYQYDPLKIVTITKNKEDSFIRTGHAFGAYGSGLVSKTKTYKDYKINGKFKKFVDTWHPILFKE